MMAMLPKTVATLLRDRAETTPDGDAIRFQRGSDWETWTWAEYWERARRAASGLLAAGVRPGDRILVLVPDVDFAVATLFGAWLLGVTPTPIGVPYRLSDVARFLDGLRETARKLHARALVTTRTFAAFAGDNEDLPVLIAEQVTAANVADDLPDPSDAAGPALVQLTSGSTGSPRGVVLAHDRLVDHLDSMSHALPSHAQSVAVSWLPLHHDMGLIGGLLFPFYNGFVANMISPADFRSRPMSWLEAMSRHRGTICAAPPSAYALVQRLARRAAEAGLRFDAWECAMIGAEPISAGLLRRFSEAFAPMGFRAEAFFPVYGLAEATVAVTFPKLLAPTRVDVIDRAALERDGVAVPPAPGAAALELVGVGAPIPRTETKIVGDDGALLPERRIGEILVAAPSLMCGYDDDAEATARAFEGRFLRTGDLGYVDGDSLFITGRRKELIIKGGHNLIPSVIEDIASEVEGVRAGCVAAVGVRSPEDETELCHVVAETKADEGEHAMIAARVREALKAQGVAVDAVRLVPPGALPKTTSGKLRRRLLADAIAAGRSLAELS
ncbi:Non-ribosomal peptide synthase [Minicystis rosea]|nr:Non-ribosomal peptide synthase [Minicystis rosea]